MANLMDLLQGQLSEGLVDHLSSQLGGADKQQTSAAATGILSTLMGALAKNTATTEGANSLNNALDRDHDGGIIEDALGFLSGQKQVSNQRTMNGQGILNHILGDRQGGLINTISQMSGLNSSKTGNLMTMLAPIVMGALGKQKKQSGLDAGGIASLLSGVVRSQSRTKKQDPMMGLITSFLDEDGDGSIADDVASKGLGLLGRLLGRKRR